MSKRWQMVTTGIAGIVIGGLAVYGASRAKPEWFLKSEKPANQHDVYRDFANGEQDLFRRFDEQFGQDFFTRVDPFGDMRKFRQHLEQDFNTPKDQLDLSDPFDRWFGKKFGGGTAEDISKREDSKYVYFDIRVGDLKSTSVQTKVESGYIDIDGKTSAKSKADNSETSFESSFHRSFPVPENVDGSKMETATEGDKIVLKFPKIR